MTKYRRSQYVRRTCIRTVFSDVDGTTFALKQLALRRAELEPGLFTAKEAARLSEKPTISPEGDEVKPRFMPTVDNLKFGLKMLVKGHVTEPAVPADDPGWKKLRGALPIRHRIVHPKRASDLRVSDSELTLALEAGIWLAEVFHAALAKSLELLEEEREREMERHRSALAALEAEKTAEEERHATEKAEIQRLREAENQRYAEERQRIKEQADEALRKVNELYGKKVGGE